jgi:hypothetical protein
MRRLQRRKALINQLSRMLESRNSEQSQSRSQERVANNPFMNEEI